MLNADMGLVSDFGGFINPITGQVSCVIQESTGNTLDVCPRASTFDQVAAYSLDNSLWLIDFHEAFTSMMLTGHTVPGSCTSLPCELA
jgi:hypothetical protein